MNEINKSLSLPASKCSAAQVALLIVDLQNDFLHPRGAYARGGAVSEKARALPNKVAQIAKSIK